MTQVNRLEEVRVQSGEVIAHRFEVVREEQADLPGVTRFQGRDTRLGGPVTIDVITSLAPSSVVRAAHRARVLRDKRLARVLAAGVERSGSERLAYVVTERPDGVRLDELLGKVAFAPRSAAAVIGAAASALRTASLHGEHHGLLRARNVVVVAPGRVVVTGLGLDGELASQAGLGRGRSEKADSVALAKLYVTAVTCMDADQVTALDLPHDLPEPARELSKRVIKGTGPHTLDEVIGAFGSGDAGQLRALVTEAPTLWWPRAAGGLAGDVVDQVPAAASDHGTTPGDALGEVSGEAAGIVAASEAEAEPVQAVQEASVEEAPVPADATTDEIPQVAEQATTTAERPRVRFGGAVDDLDEFTDMVDDQNVVPAPAVMEALLARLSTHFPQSRRLAALAEAARKRAQAPAPIRPALFLVLLMLVVMAFAVLSAWDQLQTPFELPGSHEVPREDYPQFTFGPDSPSPTE